MIFSTNRQDEPVVEIHRSSSKELYVKIHFGHGSDMFIRYKDWSALQRKVMEACETFLCDENGSGLPSNVEQS